MYKMIAALGFLAMTSATLTGCNEKEGSKETAANTKTTHYSSDKCAIDSIGGKTGATVYVAKGMVTFIGWAIDTAHQSAPQEIRLRLTGYKGTPVTFKDPSIIDRPDLIKVFGNEKLLKSGFSFTADLSSLESGGYSVVTEIPGENSSLLCQTKVLLVIE
ncbi:MULTISPECIES: hypothetical protein [Pseudomonas syringae group]|uniref:hypothetical protein n=1 Tax=Pseudomonas syringae group TaxID=136849 RepID=UPI0001AF3CFE|nr:MULTISPECIES: hypothetical protein [Pseudomonas syringae group]KPB50518.1 Lipoprotein [Pseudomonas coronafaciens pv. oryzae]KPX30509.1 Lipoprotein [Pseudomonas coronafaciens pv. garcae]KPY04150.1 Lipoprotein [Pseudomonas coronafaciens pv. oryzae]KPZ24883.1 Lipoprotein [Pseudomonas coronafaciens pv. zizaniae]MCQ3016769.1 hypothetical protein [Pseudomonas tremae]